MKARWVGRRLPALSALLAGLLVASTLVGTVSAASAPPPLATAELHAPIFNPTCRALGNGIAGVCVSIANVTVPSIVPAAGSVSAVEPNVSESIVLDVRSQTSQWNSTGSPCTGPNAPVTVNMTAVLWNGYAWYSQYDGSILHYYSCSPSQTSNRTYPWSYQVSIPATNGAGVDTFTPGMTVTWWVQLSLLHGSTYTHYIGEKFVYTYSGAWPYSPYPGAHQYGGSGHSIFSSTGDLEVIQTPLAPNWDDAVAIAVDSTPATIASGVLIYQAYVDVLEIYAPTGAVLANFTLSVAPPGVNGGNGNANDLFNISSAYSQVAGATVTYQVFAADPSGDWIVSPSYSYTVGGNGTFPNGIFVDDLEVNTTPTVEPLNQGPAASVAPGTAVQVVLSSVNSNVSIAAAQLTYVVDEPILGSIETAVLTLARINSTTLETTIPGAPVSASVNFTIQAWDYAQVSDVSPVYGYVIPSVSVIFQPPLNATETFFYVAVNDANSGGWVSGATVTLSTYGGTYKSKSSTVAGIAYPAAKNSTPLYPAGVPVNQTYTITVYDPAFLPSGDAAAPTLKLTLYIPSTFSAHQAIGLNSSSVYWVAQSGNVIIFWLNATAPGLTASPPVSPIALAGIVGLIGVVALVVPLYLWYARVQSRREEETKRVTL